MVVITDGSQHEGSWFKSWPCMFSPHLCGQTTGTPASLHSLKTCVSCLLVILNCPQECVWLFVFMWPDDGLATFCPKKARIGSRSHDTI